MDIRYNHWVKQPNPITKAVMFCLMDVSASMGEHEKDIAKRFYMLLYMFLERSYKEVDIVFIRHTTEAEEVDEQTFFYDKKTGGTKVSSVLAKCREVIEDRYPLDDWNCYIAQTSDGDNWNSDNDRVLRILVNQLLPIVQHYAYIQIEPSPDRMMMWRSLGMMPDDLWEVYSIVNEPNFDKKQISDVTEIWPVFSELFKKRNVA